MLFLVYFSFVYFVHGQFGVPNVGYQSAIVTFSFPENDTNQNLPLELNGGIIGVYGSHSPIKNVSGFIYIPIDDVYGCKAMYKDVDKNKKFIVLLSRGECKFSDKIANAQDYNASAVIIYDYQASRQPVVMSHEGADKIVAISITHQSSTYILNVLENGIKLIATIQPGKSENITTPSIRLEKTSVLFVSVAFMMLMIASLAWLVFYYIQKFRMARSQILRERPVYYFQRRQREYYKQMLAKLPSRTLKQSDELLANHESVCPICLEPYKVSDVVRELTCKHCFHRRCVDPWLRSNKTCPMCKVNMLKSLGIPDLDSASSDSVDESVNLNVVSANQPSQVRIVESDQVNENLINAAVTSTSSEALCPSSPSSHRHFPPDEDRAKMDV